MKILKKEKALSNFTVLVFSLLPAVVSEVVFIMA